MHGLNPGNCNLFAVQTTHICQMDRPPPRFSLPAEPCCPPAPRHQGILSMKDIQQEQQAQQDAQTLAKMKKELQFLETALPGIDDWLKFW